MAVNTTPRPDWGWRPPPWIRTTRACATIGALEPGGRIDSTRSSPGPTSTWLARYAPLMLRFLRTDGT